MIIDIHTHNFLRDTDAVAAAAVRNRINFWVFLGDVFRFGLYPNPAQISIINDATLAAVRRYGAQSCGFCFLNPANPADTVRRELVRCLAQPEFRGVKLEISMNCRNPGMDTIMEIIQEYEVPLLQHCWYKTVGKCPDESDPSDVAWLARRHPEAKIIMAHITGCGFRGIEDIAGCANVVVDTSGGQPEFGFVEYAVKRLGAERVVFGSDAPCRDFCSQLARVTEADISDAAREWILYKNAKRLLKL